MIEGNTFWGLDQAIWADIFLLLKFFFPSFILALFGSYYQSRKKTEVAIQVGITHLRIAAYNDIAETFSKLSQQVSPTLAENSKIQGILSFYGYGDVNTDYSICLGSEQSFDAFYTDICEAIRSNDIYLDYIVKRQCSDTIGVFTELKQFLDAYCDTERYLNREKQSVESLQKNIDFAYRITAVLMKSDINKASLQLCDVIAEQINGIRITYRKHRIRRLAYHYLREPILRFCDKYMNDDSWKGWLSWKILSKTINDSFPLISKMPKLVEIFAYLHVSDKYSPGAYFSMNEDKRQQLLSDFMKLYYVQLHHNR